MDSANRGVINFRDRAKQLRDFSGLQFGKITPTDIDGLIEYHNKCYVIIETKYMETPIPAGQKLALERMCDDLQKVKPCIVIIAHHDAMDPNQDIDVAACKVSEGRFKGEWKMPKSPKNVKEVVTKFLNTFDK